MSENRTVFESKEAQEKHNQQHDQKIEKDNAELVLEKFKIRYAKPNDIPFIKDTFLYSLYNGNDQYRRIQKDTFMKEYSRIIDLILTNPETFVKVAHLPDDEDIIISYAIVQYKEQFNILHFVYTKKMWRGQGAHLELMPNKYAYYTHITKQWLAIKPAQPTYNPFMIGR
jgi:hypothetical protein